MERRRRRVKTLNSTSGATAPHLSIDLALEKSWIGCESGCAIFRCNSSTETVLISFKRILREQGSATGHLSRRKSNFWILSGDILIIFYQNFWITSSFKNFWQIFWLAFCFLTFLGGIEMNKWTSSWVLRKKFSGYPAIASTCQASTCLKIIAVAN